ncbi:hypothetical protein VPH526E571_0043 [Vibrio phage 526E57-1]
MEIPNVTLTEQKHEYDTLDNEELLKLVFGYVQSGLEIPPELKVVCETEHIWEIVEPLIGENDVEEIMDEIEVGMY